MVSKKSFQKYVAVERAGEIDMRDTQAVAWATELATKTIDEIRENYGTLSRQYNPLKGGEKHE